jgi:hypothetical protein
MKNSRQRFAANQSRIANRKKTTLQSYYKSDRLVMHVKGTLERHSHIKKIPIAYKKTTQQLCG